MQLLIAFSGFNLLLIALFIALIFFVFTNFLIVIIRAFNSINKLTKKVESDAVILAMEYTGKVINDTPQVKLKVQVMPDKGKNFIKEIKAILPSSFDLNHGSTIRVTYLRSLYN